MIWRVVWRIVGRSAQFGFVGFFWMLLIGCIEGVATGGVLGLVMGAVSTASGGEIIVSFFWGMLIGAFAGVCIGAPTGAISCALGGALAAKRNDEVQVFNQVLNWAARGSAFGVVVGALGGTSSAPLVVLTLNRNFSAVIGEYLFYGYIAGVIGGFILGTLVGAAYGALNGKDLPVPALGWLLRGQ